MAQRLPRLRMNLDFMPSPMAERPGLLIRDSYRYSDVTMIVPPPLVGCLRLFDGEHTDLDLREHLVRLTGNLQVGEIQKQLTDSLGQAGFLEDEVYDRLREEKQRAFAEAALREAGHSGAAYPAEAEALRAAMAGYMGDGLGTAADRLAAIAAPHVSPEGGKEAYQAAYGLLGPQYKDRTFVILGTSHYGEPERFGLTRKRFVTPFGQAVTDTGLVERLAAEAGEAVQMEDYCHAVEHSIEFQVIFLQHLLGAEVRIVPILCGPFLRSLQAGGKPEDDEKVRRFLGALGELAAREGDRLLWVLGVDMAHVGRRYGDPFAAESGRGKMAEVAERDRSRIESVEQGDAGQFWDKVSQNRDDLRWCGAAPIYTFLKAAPPVRGELVRYQQWNIDEQSVVSFAAMAFRV